MLYSFHGVLHGEADVDLCMNLTEENRLIKWVSIFKLISF